MQRIGLTLAGVTLSVFLLFASFSLSGSHIVPITFDAPVAHAGGGNLLKTVVTIAVVAAVVTTGSFYALSATNFSTVAGVVTSSSGYGALGGAITTGTSAGALLGAGAINAVVASEALACISGYICGGGSHGRGVYNVAAGVGSGGVCYGPKNSCGQAYKGTYTPGRGCLIGGSYNYNNGNPPPNTCNPPSINFSAGPATIDSGQSTTLTWKSNASSCTAAGGFSTGGQPSGSASVSPTTSSTYQISCTNGATATANVNVTVLHPKIDNFTANPTRVAQGGSTSLSWSASDVSSCTVTGPSVSFSGTSGTKTVSNITSQSTYTLTCQTKGSPLTQTTLVNVAPTYQQF